jgi:hypothetical protein
LAHSLNVVTAYVSQEEEVQLGDVDARSIDAAQKALELDPDLPLALHAMANNMLSQYQWSEAQEYFQKALLQDPDSTDILEDYGHFLLYSWQTEKARVVADRMVALDPFVPIFRFMALRVYQTLGDTDKQDEHIRIALEISPDLANVQLYYLMRLLEEQDFASAHEYVDQMDLRGWTTPSAMHLLVDWISNPETEVNEEMSTAMIFAPMLVFTSGRYELWLESISANQTVNWEDYLIFLSYMSSVSDETRFQALHQIPRAREMILETGLPEYWREIGWPERCHPLGEDDFECK